MKAFQPAIVKRAIRIAILVGTILILINQSSRLLNGPYDMDLWIRIILTYLTPYTVSVISSVLSQKGWADVEKALMEQKKSYQRFPEGNPNPVFRVGENGDIVYVNPASEEMFKPLGVGLAEVLSEEFQSKIHQAVVSTNEKSILPNIRIGVRIFELGANKTENNSINVYARDITAEDVIRRLPERNPAPVLRFTEDGTLSYGNPAAQAMMDALGLRENTSLPSNLYGGLIDGADQPDQAYEVDFNGVTIALSAVWIPEFMMFNVYGTDVTAMKALTRFPAMNPNPVLRISKDEGRLLFANTAAEQICLGMNLDNSTPLRNEILARVKSSSQSGVPLEINYSERIYEVAVVAINGFDFYNLYGKDITASRKIEVLNADNERLLLNVLPPSIASRLRNGEEQIVDSIPEMSVLFADIVGFTKMSAQISPQSLLSILNEIFSAFDELAEEHGLEKIKTIGDAYMVAGGLRGEEDHATQIAKMGMKMIERVHELTKEWDESIDIRLGIHMGPGVAGVIGTKKFIYDIWGDTVNIASRMESNSLVGRIQVSDYFKQHLEDVFNFTLRGEIEIKGKGMMRTWFLDLATPVSDIGENSGLEK